AHIATANRKTGAAQRRRSRLGAAFAQIQPGARRTSRAKQHHEGALAAGEIFDCEEPGAEGETGTVEDRGTECGAARRSEQSCRAPLWLAGAAQEGPRQSERGIKQPVERPE